MVAKVVTRDTEGKIDNVICPVGRTTEGDLLCKGQECMAFTSKMARNGDEVADCAMLGKFEGGRS
jgi:hypothetical protein